jgi:hypothetical protein
MMETVENLRSENSLKRFFIRSADCAGLEN